MFCPACSSLPNHILVQMKIVIGTSEWGLVHSCVMCFEVHLFPFSSRWWSTPELIFVQSGLRLLISASNRFGQSISSLLISGCHRFDQSTVSILLANQYSYDGNIYRDYMAKGDGGDFVTVRRGSGGKLPLKRCPPKQRWWKFNKTIIFNIKSVAFIDMRLTWDWP